MDWTAVLLFAFITAIVIYFGSRRHTERMEMLRRGINPIRVIPPRTGAKTLIIGLLGIAVGLALLISFFIAHREEGLIISGLLCAFGGTAFLLYWKMTAGDRERAVRAYERHLEEVTRQKTEQPAVEQMNDTVPEQE